jgi:hypothetical protein
MTPERWRQITAVFHAALARDATVRPAYLEGACAGDAALRAEVEALLAANLEAGSFGAAPLTDGITAETPPIAAPAAAPVVRRRPTPFLWLAWPTACASAAMFAFAAWLLVTEGGTAGTVGWIEVRRGDAFYVGRVDPAGPAAGRLRAGDRVIALNGIPPVPGPGLQFVRRRLAIDDTYELAVERSGERLALKLVVAEGPSLLTSRLTFFIVGLVWCVVGLLIAFARPDGAMPRLGATAAVATGLVFLQVGVIQSGPLWQPLHMVLGFHFFCRFPSGRPTAGVWRAALVIMYVTGGYAALLGLWAHWALLTSGAAAAAQLILRYSVLYELRDQSVVFLPGVGSAVGMLLVIPYTYRRLTDEDQLRRVRWVLLGSAIALVPQLWWHAVWVYDTFVAPSSVSQFSAAVNAATIAIPITIAYAVVKHRVFDISVVVRRGLQYLLARRALQAAVAVPIVALAVTLALNRHRTLAQIGAETTGYLYWIAAAGLSLRFRKPLRQWLDRKFFREEHDREQMVLGLVDDFGNVESIAHLSEVVSAKLELALHPTAVYLWYRDPGESAVAASSNPLLTPPDFPAGGAWLSWLERRRRAAEWPLPADAGLTRRESRWFASRGVSLVIPISDSGERLAGVLLLGAKKSEEPYTAGDHRLLQAIAKQAAVVRENLHLRARVGEEERIRHDVLARLDGQLAGLLKQCPACGTCFDGGEERCSRDGQPLTLSLPVSRTIEGKYRLDRLIGTGGMGAVYAARDLRLDREVAVKILLGRAFGQPSALRRFRREAQAAARLASPHIVSVFDYGTLERQGAYIVMELVRGVTLRAELDRVTTLPPGEAADWFDGVLEGLAAAHAHGIVHRDLKPENVIGQRGTTRQIAPKILDFGLAKVSATEALVPGTMTAEGIVLGTLGYMSPEQLLGAPVDERADLFAIGVMIAEALTGTRPFRGDTFADLSRSVLHADCQLALPFPESGGLDRLLRRCLCKEPSQRIASAGELRSELVPLLRALAT